MTHDDPLSTTARCANADDLLFPADVSECFRCVTSAGASYGSVRRAIATFASKGHDLFATIHGRLSLDNDGAVIDRLWNRYVAAWYEGGKDDPKLALLRLDPERAEIWGDASSFVAGIKMLIGIDPKQDYKDKVAEVSLRPS